MSGATRRARLPRSAVSDYVNNPDPVSADAGQRISVAIAELGYVRDEAAGTLRRGTTQTFGLLSDGRTCPPSALRTGHRPPAVGSGPTFTNHDHRCGRSPGVAEGASSANRAGRHPSAVIVELQGHAEVLALEQRDDGLQVVTLLAGHPQ